MTAAEYDVQSEIEVLQSIYLEELQVERGDDGGWQVSLVLHPSTGEDSVSQFVRLTLSLRLDQQYPSSSPIISIHNPRGLSDDKLSSVQKSLQLEARSCLGSPVLYQLIEKAKEMLTESNIPHGNCVICLYGFKEGEVFTKTSCYHYFHSHCLGRYVSHSERELRRREKELEEDKTREWAEHQELSVVCPVCREPLIYDVDQLLSTAAPQLPEVDSAVVSSDFQQKWGELRKILERQRSRGGVIDPEAESNRFLIHIQEAPAADNDTAGTDIPSEHLEAPPAETFFPVPDPPPPGSSHPRGGPSQRRHHHGRGPRRGSRSRPHSGRDLPPTAAGQPPDHLDRLEKLSLSAEEPLQRDALTHREGVPRPDRDSLKEWTGSRGHRGRRRGPHRPFTRHERAGQHQWDGSGWRSRGGGGGGSSRGLQQREETL